MPGFCWAPSGAAGAESAKALTTTNELLNVALMGISIGLGFERTGAPSCDACRWPVDEANRLPAGASSHPRIRALGAYDAYFRASGVDQLAAEFRERGTVIRDGPTVRIYDVREVVVEDLNGLVLAFGESMTSRTLNETTSE